MRVQPDRAARAQPADGEPPPEGAHRRGLLERERRATWIYYRLRLERLEQLCGALVPPKRLTTAMERRAVRQAAQ